MLINVQGMQSILYWYYQGSFSKALMNIYPDIDLTKSGFYSTSCPSCCLSNCLLIEMHWDDPADRKLFFDGFAKEYAFDPLIPENWYSIPAERIKSYKVPSNK